MEMEMKQESNGYRVQCLQNHDHLGEDVYVQVPGSKSITNRALLLAMLAQGESKLKGVLFSDDSRHFLSCMEDLGFRVQIHEAQREVCVRGEGGHIPKQNAQLYVGSAGTAARFLTACLGIAGGSYQIDASEQMRNRPMSPLLKALRDLGCRITFLEENERFPFCLHRKGDLQKEEILIDIEKSSQFLSGLLISACLAKQDVRIRIIGQHGMSYVQLTQKMMEQFGVTIQVKGDLYTIPGGQTVRSREYEIEPDVSAASYFYAMSPLLGVTVQVDGVVMNSLQGDTAFLRILEQMGCTLEEREDGVKMLPPKEGRFHGVSVNMSACSDQAITLAAIAPFAEGVTTISGIGHIRYQECDRLSAMATQLRRLGVSCQTEEDSITIIPGPVHGGQIETYQDHRMAMGFALIGLRVPGVEILDPGCVAKTFEGYFRVLEDACEQIKMHF
jgi:3-phosphoshikimate 1-carboxyvinyltransferase